MCQIKLLAEDLDGLKSSDAVKSTGDAGGVTIKKFTVNAAKEQLILEFNIGSAKKKEGEPESKASAGGKAKAAPASTKKPARAGVCPYDSIPEVSSASLVCFLRCPQTAPFCKSSCQKGVLEAHPHRPCVCCR